ncbi:MAG: hypothetical protein JXR64_02615, partial [Spirochaetales bacterium]|nr:hypothetical protein [Spirochaetales bacterium]
MKTKFRLLKKARYFSYTLLCGVFTKFISCNSSKKLVKPHGDKCGCKKTKDYSPALGCPNPTSILHIKEAKKLEIHSAGSRAMGTDLPKEKLVIKSSGRMGFESPLSTELHINPNAGSIRISKPQRTITITIERNNELTQGSEWELIDFYSNGYCLMS